jgi:Fe-S-cluster containining protein
MNQTADIETELPPVPEAIKTAYRALIAGVDSLIADLSVRLQHYIRCSPGCSSCCRAFSLLPLEAALIAEKRGRLRLPAAAHDECPQLAEQRCAIYASRPLICRTQGLAIGYIDEANEQIEVSACPLNFSEQHPFEYDDLLIIDPFNDRLAELNAIYCRSAGLDPQRRLPMG